MGEVTAYLQLKIIPQHHTRQHHHMLSEVTQHVRGMPDKRTGFKPFSLGRQR